jgi:hypothetical protein
VPHTTRPSDVLRKRTHAERGMPVRLPGVVMSKTCASFAAARQATVETAIHPRSDPVARASPATPPPNCERRCHKVTVATTHRRSQTQQIGAVMLGIFVASAACPVRDELVVGQPRRSRHGPGR